MSARGAFQQRALFTPASVRLHQSELPFIHGDHCPVQLGAGKAFVGRVSGRLFVLMSEDIQQGSNGTIDTTICLVGRLDRTPAEELSV